jgi:hypothetical protein
MGLIVVLQGGFTRKTEATTVKGSHDLIVDLLCVAF